MSIYSSHTERHKQQERQTSEARKNWQQTEIEIKTKDQFPLPKKDQCYI